MEKIIYPLWKREADSRESFAEQLRALEKPLRELPVVRHLQLNIVDADVDDASGLRMQTTMAAIDAIAMIWVDTTFHRQGIEDCLSSCCEKFAGYLVTESEPIVNTEHPAAVGERTYGFSQVVFLHTPEFLTREQWLETWLGSHTTVAIDTQSTFRYVQNVVARRLTEGGPEIDAIIEESFPPEAMTSPPHFYDAVGDDEKLKARQTAMYESCARFIEFEKINVFPTSEYRLG